MTGRPPRTIPDDAMLLRRVHPSQVVTDKDTGRRRLSSGAFKDPELSVDVEDLLREDGLDWRFTLQSHPQYSLARLPAKAAIAEGQSVAHAPLCDNPYHAEVRGKKSLGIANRLLAASNAIVIEGVET